MMQKDLHSLIYGYLLLWTNIIYSYFSLFIYFLNLFSIYLQE